MKKFILATSALLLLSGCVSQDQADAKLAIGCEAGVDSLLGTAKIKEIKTKTYAFEENENGQHRRVTLNAVTKDGWMETNKTYSCLFAQQWGLFKSSHVGMLVQIKFPDGKIVGEDNGKIVGDTEDFIKLSDTVQHAMTE